MPQEYIITRIKDPDSGNIYFVKDLSAYHDNDKGVANGIAELDSNGKVPSSQLPSYVDDVEEYADITHFPAVGESGKIYIALDTNISYRWGGSTYVKIGSDLALGETASTAYRGDRGAAAYAAAVTNVETVPTENSGNLITSGAVYKTIKELLTNGLIINGGDSTGYDPIPIPSDVPHAEGVGF